jgi:hypothetical protein
MLTTFSDCQLKIDNNYGLIFPSSIKPISGTVNIGSRNKLDRFAILISDKNSNEIFRKPLGPDKSNGPFQTSFSWDLRSKSNCYVESGCYIVSLVDTSNESQEIMYCSTECQVVDTRDILSITRSLKCSHLIADVTSQTILSVYLDVIQDIETAILKRLRDNLFDDPYLVARTTEYFVQEIAYDMTNPSKSRFLDLIEEFASTHPLTAQQITNARLGLLTLFDFLVNYMSDLEDHVRADAIARCGQRNLTPNDKAQIVSSMALAIYPYCKTITFPKNAVGSTGEKIYEYIIKFGIKYLCTKRINRSIAISRALLTGNPLDSVI